MVRSGSCRIEGETRRLVITLELIVTMTLEKQVR
jgi:hypothetical protein